MAPPATADEHLVDVVTQQASAVKVMVKLPTFSAKIIPSDLGVDEADVPEEMRLGSLKLMKAHLDRLETFKTLEGRAREVVLDNSFEFLGHRMVPDAKFRTVMEGNPEAGFDANGFYKKPGLPQVQAEFNTEAQSFLADYNRMREESLAQWREWAEDSGVVEDVEMFMARLANKFPALDKVAVKFEMKWIIESVAVPSMPTTKIETMIEKSAKIAAHEQMRALYQDEMQGALQSLVIQLREQCAAICTDMLNSMDGGKTPVHQKTINRMVKFIEHFKAMNITKDAAFERELESFQREFLTVSAGEYRKNEGAMSSLRDALQRLKDRNEEVVSEDAAAIVESFGAIGKRKIVV